MDKQYREAYSKVFDVIEVFEKRHPEYSKEINHLYSNNFNISSIEVGRQRSNFGYCKYQKTSFHNNHNAVYTCRISYNKRLLLEEEKGNFLNTIVHEIFHAIAQNVEPGCGHRGAWKELANIYNELFADVIPISRLGAWNSEEPISSPIRRYKYVVKCDCCGAKKYYKNRGKVIKNIYDYRCKKCGCNELEVEELY